MEQVMAVLSIAPQWIPMAMESPTIRIWTATVMGSRTMLKHKHPWAIPPPRALMPTTMALMSPMKPPEYSMWIPMGTEFLTFWTPIVTMKALTTPLKLLCTFPERIVMVTDLTMPLTTPQAIVTQGAE